MERMYWAGFLVYEKNVLIVSTVPNVMQPTLAISTMIFQLHNSKTQLKLKLHLMIKLSWEMVIIL